MERGGSQRPELRGGHSLMPAWGGRGAGGGLAGFGSLRDSGI